MINRANELCNKYMLDTISTGATIAFAMECFEHGLIGLEDTGGIDLRFGNADALLPMIERIARRQGFGNLLAEGSKRAAEVIGGDARSFHHGGERPGTGHARAAREIQCGHGLCHFGNWRRSPGGDARPHAAKPGFGSFKAARPLGITVAQPARSLSDEKMNQFFILEQWNSLEKTVGFCFFGPAPRSFIQPEDVLTAINAATGWNVDMAEALRIGERGTNLARVFNAREGFSRKDDTLPERLFQELENGALKGQALPTAGFRAGADPAVHPQRLGSRERAALAPAAGGTVTGLGGKMDRNYPSGLTMRVAKKKLS